MRAETGRFCRRSLVFNLGFADEHDRNVVAYGIHAMTLAALQPLSVMDQFHGYLAERADEDFQQFGIHGHGEKW